MAVASNVSIRSIELTDVEQKRIDHSLESLSKRLTNFTNPSIELSLDSAQQAGSIEATLRVVLGVRDTVLRSKQESRTADHAVKLACDDIKRQLERTVSELRGTPTYGTPSRRSPENLRPANRTDEAGEDGEMLVDDTFDLGDEQNTDAWAMTPPED